MYQLGYQIPFVVSLLFTGFYAIVGFVAAIEP